MIRFRRPAFALLAACCMGSNLLAQTSAPVSDSFTDFLSLESYEHYLSPIQPEGFFAVGRRYVHPPRVEWKNVKDAARYRLTLVQRGKVLGRTEAPSSPQVADQGWATAKPGIAGIVIEGFSAKDERVALSRLFPFYVAPDFDASLTVAPARSYREAVMLAFKALYEFTLPSNTPPPKDGPGATILPVLLGCAGTSRGYSPYSFPVLHDYEHVDMLEALVPLADAELKIKISRYAQSVGDHLLMAQLPVAANKYGGLIRGCVDHQGQPALGYFVADPTLRAKALRLVEPAKNGYAGEALVKIYELTKAEKYLKAAEDMAGTLIKTQLQDGSWPARVDGLTGEVIGSYSSSSGSVASFLNRLHKYRRDDRYAQTESRARAWMLKYPMKTYGWVVNYDDGGAPATLANPYAGSLSNWDLFGFCRYLSRHRDTVPQAPGLVEDQLRWNDNQFVFFGDDPVLPINPFYPTCAEQGSNAAALMAGGCWVPMDFHTANWGRTLVAAYRLTGSQRWLDEAKAAGNALTHYQFPDGRTMTWMCDRNLGTSAHVAGAPGEHSFWPAAWALSATLWAELAVAE